MSPRYACHSESNDTRERAPARSCAAHMPRAWAQRSSYQSTNLLRGVSDKENSSINGGVAEEDVMGMDKMDRMDMGG